MIHPLVLTAFVAAVSASLSAYGFKSYALLVTLSSGGIVLLKAVQSKRVYVALLVSAAVWLSVSLACTLRAQHQDAAYQSGFAYENKKQFNGQVVVDGYPSYKFANNQYVLLVPETGTRILVSTHPHVKFGYLDELTVRGSLRDIRQEGDQWRGNYRKFGLHYTMFLPQIEKAETARADTYVQLLRLHLFGFKTDLRDRIVGTFSSRASALMLGMLLGERDELSKEEKDTFNAVGLSHILVVSGYNISLLIAFVFAVFKFLPRHARVAVALLIIALFVLLIGYEPSVVRAALMGSIIIFAKLSRRPGSALNVLFLVAAIMVLTRPYGVQDVGLHLSFIATFALLVMPNIKRVSEVLMTTVWVFLFVSPYVLYLSGSFSLAGIASNVAVAFILAPFMLVGILSVTFTYLSVHIGLDILLVETASRYVFLIAEVFAYMNSYQMNIPPSLMTAGYVLLGFSIVWVQNRYATNEFIERHYRKFVPQRPS